MSSFPLPSRQEGEGIIAQDHIQLCAKVKVIAYSMHEFPLADVMDYHKFSSLRLLRFTMQFCRC